MRLFVGSSIMYDQPTGSHLFESILDMLSDFCFFLIFSSFYNGITKLIVNPANAAILVNFYMILTIGEYVNKLLAKHTQLLCSISIFFSLPQSSFFYSGSSFLVSFSVAVSLCVSGAGSLYLIRHLFA
jgi:hypothetical protein